MIAIAVIALLASAQGSGQSIQAQAEQARQLLLAGRTEEAISIYRRLALAYPDNATIQLDLSIANFKAGLYRATVEATRAALRSEPNNPAANLFLGASYLKLDDPAEALEPLQKAAQSIPNDRNAHLMLAEALLGTRAYKEALTYFQDLSNWLPDNPRVWYGLGQTYEGLANQAAAELEAKAPKSSYWLLLQADAFRQQQKWGSAFRAYRAALASGPPIGGIHEGLARVYEGTGHADWAAQESASERKASASKATLAEVPDEFQVYRSNAELAAKSYEKLMSLPPSLESHLHRAKQLSKEGQNTDAVAEWRAAFKIDPESPAICLGLAQSLYRSLDCAAMLPVLEPLLQQDARAAEANFLYGTALLQLERPGEAVTYLRTALRQNEHLIAAAAALGQALLLNGKPGEAVGYLEQAIAVDQDTQTTFQLFRVYQLLGNEQKAQDAFAVFQARRSLANEQRAEEDGSKITAPEK